MAEQIITEFTLWSPIGVNWESAKAKLKGALGQIARLTVPTIGWTPLIGELIPITASRAVFRIIWTPAGTPAFLAALIPLLPAIFSIIKSLVIGLIAIVGLKVITGQGVVEEQSALITDAIDAHNKDQISDAQFDEILGIVREGPEQVSGFGDIEQILKWAVIAGIVIIGGILIFQGLQTMRSN